MLKNEKQKLNKSFFDASNKTKLVNLGQIAAVVIFVAFMINHQYSTYEETPPKTGFTELDALLICQTALTRLSRDPDTASVPYVNNYGKGNEYYFAWGGGTKYARMRNGLGLEVPVSAFCIVNGNTRTITSLTFNGESII